MNRFTIFAFSLVLLMSPLPAFADLSEGRWRTDVERDAMDDSIKSVRLQFVDDILQFNRTEVTIGFECSGPRTAPQVYLQVKRMVQLSEYSTKVKLRVDRQKPVDLMLYQSYPDLSTYKSKESRPVVAILEALIDAKERLVLQVEHPQTVLGAQSPTVEMYGVQDSDIAVEEFSAECGLIVKSKGSIDSNGEL